MELNFHIFIIIIFRGGTESMKYENVENKDLFKNWLGISEVEIGENVRLSFNDRECYDAIFELYYTPADEKLNENSSDMEVVLTNETFEDIIDEYDLELSMRNCLVVLNS